MLAKSLLPGKALPELRLAGGDDKLDDLAESAEGIEERRSKGYNIWAA